MDRRTRILIVLGLAVILLTSGLLYAREVIADSQASINLPARWSYAAKFVCGYQQQAATPPNELAVKPGNYATSINLHNPGQRTVNLWKKVVVSYPERWPNSTRITPTKRFTDTLYSDHAMYVDCTEIVNLLTLNGTTPSSTFLEGFVVIDAAIGTAAPAELDVFGVYTTASSSGSTVNSIEIVPVIGRRLPAGTWPY